MDGDGARDAARAKNTPKRRHKRLSPSNIGSRMNGSEPPTPEATQRVLHARAAHNAPAAGTLSFEVTNRSNLRALLHQLVALKYMAATAPGVLVFASDLSRRVIYHQMLASDRKKVHAQVVAWHAFRLATRFDTALRLKMRAESAAEGALKTVPEEETPQKAKETRLMQVHGEMAFHALCGDEPALAFDLCVRAFSFALRAGLVDVAKGYVNDCALIGENHVLPPQLAPAARVALMRAAASIRADDLEAAAESLEVAADATKYEPKCLDGVKKLYATRADDPARVARCSHANVALGGTSVEFPTTNDALEAYHDAAARGPTGGLWGLGREAWRLRRQLQTSTRRIAAERAKLNARVDGALERKII